MGLLFCDKFPSSRKTLNRATESVVIVVFFYGARARLNGIFERVKWRIVEHICTLHVQLKMNSRVKAANMQMFFS